MSLRRPDPDDLSRTVMRLRTLVGAEPLVRRDPDEAMTDRFDPLDVDIDAAADYDVIETDPPVTGRTARRARLDPGRRSTTAFAVTAVVSAALAAAVTWLSRPVAEPVAAPASYAAPVAVAATSSAAPTSAKVIVVSVIGKVAKPGLVTLPEGARVSDAITACGGALPDADLTALNLAAKLADGEQIAVGVPGLSNPGSGAQPGVGGAAQTGPVNLNAADAAALDALPGIGPVLAARIVDFRTKNGPFATVDDLANVPGIGPSILANIRDLVTV